VIKKYFFDNATYEMNANLRKNQKQALKSSISQLLTMNASLVSGFPTRYVQERAATTAPVLQRKIFF
jgi:hypothetical protein